MGLASIALQAPTHWLALFLVYFAMKAVMAELRVSPHLNVLGLALDALLVQPTPRRPLPSCAPLITHAHCRQPSE